MNIRELIDKVTDSAKSYPTTTFSLENNGHINTCINPYSYHIIKRFPELYSPMDGLFIDGMIMCWLIRILWNKKIPRLSFDMSGMATDLFSRINCNPNESIYFIGAKANEIEQSISQIQRAYPTMNIVGYRHGFFSSEMERLNVIKKIIQLNPSFVVIGMGSPIQEKFAIDLKQNGYKGNAFTCGGFLHQTKDRLNYYPKWINKYNLRAFYRLSKEKGLFKRLYFVLLQFPIRFVIDTITYRFKKVLP